MVCPRCGALIDSLPCPECGFPENMKKAFSRCGVKSEQRKANTSYVCGQVRVLMIIQEKR
jgi:hypothetical protein